MDVSYTLIVMFNILPLSCVFLSHVQLRVFPSKHNLFREILWMEMIFVMEGWLEINILFFLHDEKVERNKLWSGQTHIALKGTLQNWFLLKKSCMGEPLISISGQNLYKFEIDRPSSSRGNSEQLITYFAWNRFKN